MKRFEPVVENCLLRNEWFEGRSVLYEMDESGYMDYFECVRDECDGRMHDKQLKFLDEFGGLCIGYMGPDHEEQELEFCDCVFATSVLCYPDYEKFVAPIEECVGTLAAIGNMVEQRIAFVMDPAGAVYALPCDVRQNGRPDHVMVLLGIDGDTFLKNAILGKLFSEATPIVRAAGTLVKKLRYEPFPQY